jgi:hypothetical protein
MTECKLWQRLIANNPAWAERESCYIKPATLRRLVALTWREATREERARWAGRGDSNGGPVVDYLMDALKKGT